MSASPSKESEKTARDTFAPMYSILAEQIIEETGTMEGLCLDIGTGILLLELAKRTKLVVYALDISEEMCKIACRNLLKKGSIIKILEFNEF